MWLWWGPFIQSRKCMSLKFTGEFCVMTMKNDTKFQEDDKFGPEHSKISKICNLMGFFWTKYIMFELKKYRGVIFDGTEHWCNIWRKTDLCFEKWLFLAIQQTVTHKEHLWYSFWSEAIFWSSSETLAPWS